MLPKSKGMKFKGNGIMEEKWLDTKIQFSFSVSLSRLMMLSLLYTIQTHIYTDIQLTLQQG